MKNKLEQLRKERGMTQEKLGEDLGITKDYVSMLERGVRTPGFKLAKEIAKYFEVTIEDIFM